MTTNYANDLFVNISDNGMTKDLWNLAKDDLTRINKLKVTTDKERNLLFYLDHFIEDLFEEFEVKDVNKNKTLEYAFNFLRKQEKVDLTDIRHAVFLAIRKTNKLAYPNMQMPQSNMKPERDVSKWIEALRDIYSSKEGKYTAIDKITEGWSPMEKTDFMSWFKYYENGDYEKYNIRTAAPITFPTPPVQQHPQIPQPQENGVEEKIAPHFRVPGRPRKTKKTLQESKQSLISRLDSASKLLREFARVWPEDIWNRLSQALSDLQREIIPLQTVATISDRIFRTAGLWDQGGFPEGADLLRKIAQMPEDDITSQIEKALTGKEYDIKDSGEAPPAELGEADLPPIGETDLPPLGEEMAPPDMGGVPAGVEEDLPPPETPPAPPEGPPTEEIMEVGEEESPFKGKTIQDALNVLEPLAQKLSEREFSHELSKADMILDSLNIASHFPELAEAQSKALELNLYVLSRLKSIINKLKGGLKPEKKEEAPPSVEMEEITETNVDKTAPAPAPVTPAAPAPSAREKEMFEVKE